MMKSHTYFFTTAGSINFQAIIRKYFRGWEFVVIQDVVIFLILCYCKLDLSLVYINKYQIDLNGSLKVPYLSCFCKK